MEGVPPLRPAEAGLRSGWKKNGILKSVALFLFFAIVLTPLPGGADDSAYRGPVERTVADETLPDTLPAASIPPRPKGAMTGSEFARRTAGMSEEGRQQAALVELRKGNIPHRLRTLKPVRLTNNAPGREWNSAVVWVMPDYLAIGSEKDFLRIPLTYPSAAAVADEFGFALPTPKIVDAIYEQADFTVEPQPLPAGAKMRSNEFYLRHQRIIQSQLAGCPKGALISGHKKDVVLTNRLFKNPNKIAIYGWHRSDGNPIQPLSTVHEAGYADYSHGIRLVSSRVRVDGKYRTIFDVLEDPEAAALFSYEGPIERPWALMHADPQGEKPVVSFLHPTAAK